MNIIYEVIVWPPGGYTVAFVNGHSNVMPSNGSYALKSDAQEVADAMNLAYRRGQTSRSREIRELICDE